MTFGDTVFVCSLLRSRHSVAGYSKTACMCHDGCFRLIVMRSGQNLSSSWDNIVEMKSVKRQQGYVTASSINIQMQSTCLEFTSARCLLHYPARGAADEQHYSCRLFNRVTRHSSIGAMIVSLADHTVDVVSCWLHGSRIPRMESVHPCGTAAGRRACDQRIAVITGVS